MMCFDEDEGIKPLRECEFPFLCSNMEIEMCFPPRGDDVGRLVAVSPCDPELKEGTFLGMYLGQMQRHNEIGVSGDDEKCIHVRIWQNHAILVPELHAVLFGDQCWWQFIDDPSQLEPLDDKIRAMCEHYASLVG